MEFTFGPVLRAAAFGGSVFGVVSTRRWKQAEQGRKDAERLVHELEREVAAMKREADELREMDRVRADFVSVITDDVRTPLTAILGYSEVVLDPQTTGDRDTVRPYVETIRASALNLERTLDSLLDRYTALR